MFIFYYFPISLRNYLSGAQALLYAIACAVALEQYDLKKDGKIDIFFLVFVAFEKLCQRSDQNY